MPFVPVPNVAQVDMVFMYNGQRCENVYHVQQESPYDQTSLAVLATLFRDWWDDEFKAGAPNTLALVLIVARALDTDSSPSIEFSAGLPIQGQVTAAGQLPNNVTQAIKWTTALRGRSYRGRTYHIGLTEDMVIGNTVQEPHLAYQANRYNALLTALDGLPGNLVVVSKIHNGVERTTGIATPVQAVSVDSTVDSQRRRLPGRGA